MSQTEKTINIFSIIGETFFQPKFSTSAHKRLPAKKNLEGQSSFGQIL